MRPSERVNLHPSTHSPAELPTKSFDVICIGSGWAGRVLAARIVKAGLSALIVESELFGGDCPFWACVPSKVLLRSPEVLNAAKGVGGARERVNGDNVDTSAMFKRRDMITMGWDDTEGLIPLIESTGAHMVRGVGKLAGEKKVQVIPNQGEAVLLDARLAVVLCTGSSPVIPNVPGLREANPWTPRDATSASYVPEHLIIVGGGVVGSEMATAYSSFGAKVTVIASSTEILAGVDSEAGKIVRESLEARGVSFHLSAKVIKVQRPAEDKVIVELSSGSSLSGSEILLAAGRKANLEEIGLEDVRVRVEGRFLPVDEHLRVRGVEGKWLYAAGDLNGRAPLTHISKYHAAVAANAILANAKGESDEGDEWSNNSATADKKAVPQVIFTDPVVASVGLTRTAAKAQGLSFREITAPMTSPGYNIHSDEPASSWAQWLLDDDNRLVGATFVGTDAAEVLHASTMAIVGGITLDRMMHAIPSFPTLSWMYYNLMDAAGV